MIQVIAKGPAMSRNDRFLSFPSEWKHELQYAISLSSDANRVKSVKFGWHKRECFPGCNDLPLSDHGERFTKFVDLISPGLAKEKRDFLFSCGINHSSIRSEFLSLFRPFFS
jgi:hypothetical protein